MIQSSLLILLPGALLNNDVPAHLLAVALKPQLLSLVVLQRVPLAHRLLSQLLILIMNTSLNLLDVSLRILLGLQFELLKISFEVSFLILFHSGLLDFDSVFLFLNSFLETCTILSPSHEFQFVFEFLALGTTHLLQIIRQLLLFDLGVVDLLLVLRLNLFHLALVLLHCLSLILLIRTFMGLDLALK